MRDLADVHYPEATCIRVVQDNLSTHSAGALYEAFLPDEEQAAGGWIKRGIPNRLGHGGELIDERTEDDGQRCRLGEQAAQCGVHRFHEPLGVGACIVEPVAVDARHAVENPGCLDIFGSTEKACAVFVHASGGVTDGT
jgi:hypothetical protein